MEQLIHTFTVCREQTTLSLLHDENFHKRSIYYYYYY